MIPAETTSPAPNERLNTIISVGLLIVLVISLVIYAVIYLMKGQPDGQLVQLAGTIAGVLGGFIARGSLQHSAGTNVEAADSVNVTAPASTDAAQGTVNP